MIRTYIVKCELNREQADLLNKTSAAVYNWFVNKFWEIVGPYEEKRKWPSVFDIDKIFAKTIENEGALTVLNANAIDCARDGLKHALTSARAAKKANVASSRFARRPKVFRTTMWNGLKFHSKIENDYLVINRKSIYIKLPKFLQGLPIDNFLQVGLVFNRNHNYYNWHITVDDGRIPEEVPGENTLACDFGEIHPAAVTDGQIGVVLSARVLRSERQNRNKRLAELSQFQSQFNKGSRRWKKVQRRKNKFLAKQKRIEKDILHKVSRKLVQVAKVRKCGRIAIGDVRNIGDGKRLHKNAQQAISGWEHGQLRQMIEYKAEEYSIKVDLVSEKYTTKTCPECGQQYKPTGRNYNCPSCGFSGHRDIVGATNILSKALYDDLGKVKYPEKIMYLRPCRRSSPVVNRQVAQ